jgi:hypothetical protein
MKWVLLPTVIKGHHLFRAGNNAFKTRNFHCYRFYYMCYCITELPSNIDERISQHGYFLLMKAQFLCLGLP